MDKNKIFQTIESFDGRKLIDEMNKHIEENPSFEKGPLKYDKIDSFFHNLIKRYGLGDKITKIRTHFMKPGSQYDIPHDHVEKTGVYYLQVPKNCGSIYFPNLNVEIEPHEGLFVLVPSKEKHGITENKSDGIRIALAFCIT